MATVIQTKPHVADSTGENTTKNRPPVSNPILKDEWCYYIMDADSKNVKMRSSDKKEALSTKVSRTDLSKNENNEMEENNENAAAAAASGPPLLPQPSTSKISLNSQNNWGDNRREIYCFKTVKELCELYSFMLLPSKGRVKNDYMFFKKDIKPEWEDPHNQNGGKWQLTLPNRYRAEHLDRMVVDTLFAITTDRFAANSYQICGLYVQRRQKEDRVCLWTNDKSEANKAAILEIGKIWKKILRLDEKSKLTYLKHEDSPSSSSSSSSPSMAQNYSNGNGSGDERRKGSYVTKRDWKNQKSAELYSV